MSTKKAIDPMDFYEELGADKLGLSASEIHDEDGLVGLVQVPVGAYLACAHLHPKEMRELAVGLMVLADAIEEENKEGEK